MPGVSAELARNERGQWLLEIDAGRVFRFTDKAGVSVTKRNGDVVRFNTGLGAFTLGTSLGAEASLGFRIDSGIGIRTDLLNWAKLRAEGIDIEERPATLRRWFPGQKLEEARVWLKGVTANAQYSDPRAHPGQLAISVERRPTKGRTIPNPQQRVDRATWPVRVASLATTDPIIDGATYPIPIGAPGHVPGSSAGNASTPALLVEVVPASDDDRFLIARGRVQAAAVTLFDIANNISETRTVKTMTDLLGQTVSYVDVIGSAITVVKGNKYYIGWQADGGAVMGGGVIDPRTGRLVRGAVDVITFLLGLNGTEVDLGRMAAIEPRLNNYFFDFVINSPVVAFEVLRREVLSLLPVVERQGEHGLYYGLERWEARKIDVTVRLDADARRVQKTAPTVRRQQAEIYNEFSIEYAPFLISGRYSRRRVLTAEAGFLRQGPRLTTTDTRIIGDLRCALSQSKYGVKVAPPIKTRAIFDDATAIRILRDRASRDALPKRVTQYTGGPEFEFVQEGAIASILDTESGFTDAIARIDNVTVGDGVTVMDVTVLDDPVQESRLVG